MPEPIPTLPKSIALASTLALLLDVVVKVRVPLKALLVFVKVMAFAPALKLEVPFTVNTPVSAIPALAVVATAVKLVPMVEVAKFKVLISVMVAVVLLVRATVPVKLLLAPLVVKSIVEEAALKVVVPGTVTVPLWLIAPPEVRFKLPLDVKVSVGTTIAALL